MLYDSDEWIAARHWLGSRAALTSQISESKNTWDCVAFPSSEGGALTLRIAWWAHFSCTPCYTIHTRAARAVSSAARRVVVRLRDSHPNGRTASDHAPASTGTLAQYICRLDPIAYLVLFPSLHQATSTQSWWLSILFTQVSSSRPDTTELLIHLYVCEGRLVHMFFAFIYAHVLRRLPFLDCCFYNLIYPHRDPSAMTLPRMLPIRSFPILVRSTRLPPQKFPDPFVAVKMLRSPHSVSTELVRPVLASLPYDCRFRLVSCSQPCKFYSTRWPDVFDTWSVLICPASSLQTSHIVTPADL